MAQVVRFSRAVSTTVVNDIKAALDAGAGAAKIKLYTGTMPATPETGVTSQTLLGTLTFTDPVGTESGGTLTLSPITSDPLADNSGTATWARYTTSADVAIFDADVGVIGSGAFLEMVTTSIAANAPIAITSGTIRLP